MFDVLCLLIAASVHSNSHSSQPHRRLIPLGAKVVLECLSSSAETPEGRGLFWLHNGKEIMLDDNVDLDQDSGSLIILRATLANEGNYTCGVKTPKGESRLGETASIFVLGKAIIIIIIPLPIPQKNTSLLRQSTLQRKGSLISFCLLSKTNLKKHTHTHICISYKVIVIFINCLM